MEEHSSSQPTDDPPNGQQVVNGAYIPAPLPEVTPGKELDIMGETFAGRTCWGSFINGLDKPRLHLPGKKPNEE